MLVSKVSLKNFRNYEHCELQLQAGRTVLIGENAQGKSNLLEAIELLSTGRSARAEKDTDLLRWGADFMSAEVDFVSGGHDESLRIRLVKAAPQPGKNATSRLEKQIAINGVNQRSWSDLTGRLLTVSFASHDLNLLRGGPKFRRDWLDGLISKLRPTFNEIFANYAKSISQRNKLLKMIFERGKVTVSDQDQLLVWDKQVARYGAQVIKERLQILSRLLPLAEQHQRRISRDNETLTMSYVFKAAERVSDEFEGGEEQESPVSTGQMTALQLAQMTEDDLAKTLLRLLKERRSEEIRRKQTTVGPHRDDLVFGLNGVDAVSFASQGQHRSIVLSLKIAEVALIRQSTVQMPVLLLDDVLAELDQFRQGLLLGLVEEGLQTIITTTHLSGFDPKWLEGAHVFKVHAGSISPAAAV